MSLHSVAFAHEALKARPEDQVECEFLVGEHEERGFPCPPPFPRLLLRSEMSPGR